MMSRATLPASLTWIAVIVVGMALFPAGRAKAQPTPPACPTFERKSATIPEASKGHHSVTLTWKPSPTKVDQAKNAVGYCVYRHETPDISPPKINKRISDCLDCQLVTEVAIAGTGCVDYRVKDNTKYSYVVTYYVKPQRATVGAATVGAISDVSNEALVDTSKPGPAAPPYPPCH